MLCTLNRFRIKCASERGGTSEHIEIQRGMPIDRPRVAHTRAPHIAHSRNVRAISITAYCTENFLR